MLLELKVNDYAIIDSISVNLGPGLNVLTGETGAGKSIIVGALSFALGERTSDDVIRKGADTCCVEAVFGLTEGLLQEKHRQGGIVRPGETQLTVRRELRSGGRSKCSVNGRQISLTGLRDLGDRLVDFHGQHEHQLLLHPSNHVDFLDGFGKLTGAKTILAEKRKTFLDTSRRIRSLEEDIDRIRSQEDFIRFEIDELERHNLKAGEDERIESEIAILEHAEKILAAGLEALDALYDGDDAAIRSLSKARAVLGKITSFSKEIGGLAENLDEAGAIIKDVGESLRDHLGRIDLDPRHLEELRERQAVIERMKRKYGETLSEVLEHLDRLKTGLENRGDLEQELARLQEERGALEAETYSLAVDLSRKRKTTARGFQDLVATELRSLGLPGGAFRVVFEDLDEGDPIHAPDGGVIKIGETGIDSVEFFVRTNAGEDLMPLRRIASGGEVSRVMLALKKILADVDEVNTLVFDEIDSGIGGSMADVVARKLCEVAQKRQVICITHLAQIAAPGDHHLAVGKSTVGGRTVTEVSEISGEVRVREIARMIGGRKPLRSAMVHAEEILKRSLT